MPAPNPNPPQALCEEILAEARRESERILQTARQEADALLARTKAQAGQARQQKLEAARAEAARRREQILATVPLETARLNSTKVEALLQSVYEEVRRSLSVAAGVSPDYRETLIALAVEAISQMTGETFIVKLSPADFAAFGRDLDRDILRRLGESSHWSITLRAEPSLTEPGLLVEDTEGYQLWDNRLPARLDRMWPELRRQIALGAGLVSESNGAGTACPRESGFGTATGTSCPRPEQRNSGQSWGGENP